MLRTLLALLFLSMPLSAADKADPRAAHTKRDQKKAEQILRDLERLRKEGKRLDDEFERQRAAAGLKPGDVHPGMDPAKAYRMLVGPEIDDVQHLQPLCDGWSEGREMDGRQLLESTHAQSDLVRAAALECLSLTRFGPHLDALQFDLEAARRENQGSSHGWVKRAAGQLGLLLDEKRRHDHPFDDPDTGTTALQKRFYALCGGLAAVGILLLLAVFRARGRRAFIIPDAFFHLTLWFGGFGAILCLGLGVFDRATGHPVWTQRLLEAGACLVPFSIVWALLRAGVVSLLDTKAAEKRLIERAFKASPKLRAAAGGLATLYQIVEYFDETPKKWLLEKWMRLDAGPPISFMGRHWQPTELATWVIPSLLLIAAACLTLLIVKHEAVPRD